LEVSQITAQFHALFGPNDPA
jgi:hypothetical protein